MAKADNVNQGVGWNFAVTATYLFRGGKAMSRMRNSTNILNRALTIFLILAVASPAVSAFSRAAPKETQGFRKERNAPVQISLIAYPGETVSRTVRVLVELQDNGKTITRWEFLTLTVTNLVSRSSAGDQFLPKVHAKPVLAFTYYSCYASLNDYNGDFTARVDYHGDPALPAVWYDGGSTVTHIGKAGWSAVSSWHSGAPTMSTTSVHPSSHATFHWTIFTDYHDLNWSLYPNGACGATGSSHF